MDWQDAGGVYSLWLYVEDAEQDILLARAKGSDFWTEMVNAAKAKYGEDDVYYTWESVRRA